MAELTTHHLGNGRPTGVDEESVYRQLREDVFDRLKAATDASPTVVATPNVEAVIQRELDTYARRTLRAGRTPLHPDAEDRIRRRLRDIVTGAGSLEALLADPTIETININGHDQVFASRRDGTKDQVGPVADSDEELAAMLREMAAAAARNGGQERRFDRAQPELSLRLPHGARLHALMDVTDRVCVSIRLFPPGVETLAELVRRGEMTLGMAALFDAMVQARYNMVVSGGPTTGKTTLMCALINAIPSRRRILLIEDVTELRLDRATHPDVVRMQTRLANVEGVGEWDLSQGLRASLRMTPDVVIVGEVRGPEVILMAKAMSIGVDGSMSTVHASDSAQALERMTAYAMEPPASYGRDAAVALLASAVHIVIHLDTTRDGTRVVSSVREVVGGDGGQILSNEVYTPGPDKRAVPATQLRADTLSRLIDVGGLHPDILDTDRW